MKNQLRRPKRNPPGRPTPRLKRRSKKNRRYRPLNRSSSRRRNRSRSPSRRPNRRPRKVLNPPLLPVSPAKPNRNPAMKPPKKPQLPNPPLPPRAAARSLGGLDVNTAAISPRSPLPLATVLLVLLLVGLGLPRSATAGEYTIHICEADEAGYTSSAFEEFAERGMKWRRACDPLGPEPRGIVSANVSRPGRVPRGAESGFILSAPPGTGFSRLRWSGLARRRDCRYALQVFADGGPAAVSIKNVRANHRCPRSGMAQ